MTDNIIRWWKERDLDQQLGILFASILAVGTFILCFPGLSLIGIGLIIVRGGYILAHHMDPSNTNLGFTLTKALSPIIGGVVVLAGLTLIL